jgi:hypothetical protein
MCWLNNLNEKYNRDGIKHFAYVAYDVDVPLKNTFKEYRKRLQ